MKQLTDIGVTGVLLGGKYVCVLVPRGSDEPICYAVTGKQAIELIKDVFNYKDWAEEFQEDNPGSEVSIKQFLKYADSLNDDGWPHLTVFKA